MPTPPPSSPVLETVAPAPPPPLLDVLDKEAVDDLLRQARLLAERGQDPSRAHAMFTAVLKLDPARLEAHVDLVQLDVQLGRVARARERMQRLSEEYATRAKNPDARGVLRNVDAWEEEFAAGWDKHLRHNKTLDLPAPPTHGTMATTMTPEEREELFSRYSVRTLRAKAMVRRDPNITHRHTGTSLAHSLRKLAGRSTAPTKG